MVHGGGCSGAERGCGHGDGGCRGLSAGDPWTTHPIDGRESTVTERTTSTLRFVLRLANRVFWSVYMGLALESDLAVFRGLAGGGLTRDQACIPRNAANAPLKLFLPDPIVYSCSTRSSV